MRGLREKSFNGFPINKITCGPNAMKLMRNASRVFISEVKQGKITTKSKKKLPRIVKHPPPLLPHQVQVMVETRN